MENELILRAMPREADKTLLSKQLAEQLRFCSPVHLVKGLSCAIESVPWIIDSG